MEGYKTYIVVQGYKFTLICDWVPWEPLLPCLGLSKLAEDEEFKL